MFLYDPLNLPCEISCNNHKNSMQIGRGVSNSVPFQSPNYFIYTPVLQNIKKSKTFIKHSGIKNNGEPEMEEKKKEGNVEVNGHANFVDGKLVPPKVKKSAEELLAELPDTPHNRKVDREIAAIEQKMEKKKIKRPRHKEVKAETMVEKILKIDGITSHFNKYDHVVKYKERTICWVSDRNYGIALSTWGTGGKDWKTTRIYNQKQMYEQIEVLKGKLNDIN